MNCRSKKYFLLAVGVLLFAISSLTHAQTLKIATLAPEGSSWMKAMRAGAAEIKQRTEGRVKIKFYGGGVQGNDKQVRRKMRIGQLHGGAFASTALIMFQAEAALYGMPVLFNNLEEVQFVRERMDGKMRNLLEQAGYVNFGFAGAGFAYLMSNRPIANLDDMQGLKIWIPEGDIMSYGAVRALGISPIAMPLTDVLTGLQTELIDTIMGPPAATIILQWNTGVSHITEVPLAYVYGILVIEKKFFDRLAATDQAVVREVMEQVYRGFDERGNKDNVAAFEALLADGMQRVALDEGQFDIWRNAVQKSNHKLTSGGAMDTRLMAEIECYIATFRSGSPEQDCMQ